MTTDEPISAWIEAESVPPTRSLDPAFVHVDPTLAAALATAHTRTFVAAAMETTFGVEELTADVPNASVTDVAELDERGLVREGTRVGPGSVLVGKVTPIGGGPLTPEEKLLRAIFGEKSGDVRDTSLRCPPGCSGTVETARMVAPEAKGEKARAEVVIAWDRPLAVGDELHVDGPGGEARVTVARIESLGGGRALAWAGAAGSVRVAKISMVEDLIHARSIGPYSIVTQQPLGGREQFGGQRISAAQAAALASQAPWAAWEMFTVKSDSITGRVRAYESLVRRIDIELPAAPDDEPARGQPQEGGSGADIFSFFEKPRRADAQPGDVAAEVPESIEILARELAALAIEVRLTAPELGARLLTSEAIRARSHGQVKRPETINYRTHKPERDGLFCARIFGPVKDYECICGKYTRMKHRGVVCEKCGVEVIQSKVRRERFGHFELAVPVVHPLFKDAVARLLDISRAELDDVIDGAAGFDTDGRLQRVEEVEEVETGGAAVRAALEAIDLDDLRGAADVETARLARSLIAQEIEPAALMLEVVPVLPPDLRPLVPLDGGRWATSDLNDLYRRAINRHNRLARLIELDAPVIILRNEFAELQRAVDQLFDNERQQKRMKVQNRVLRSIGRIVEQRFAEITRRRVDYSGVSRFVVDSELARGRCRLPRRMALELYKPMAYGIMETKGFVVTIKSAKAAVEQRRDFAIDAITEASAEAPVLLLSNAAIVAREVELWDEPAIAVDTETARLLAGLDARSAVCVHVPLGSEARDEVANFDDVELDGLDQPEARGWLSAAVFEGDGLTRVAEAVLEGRREAVDDPLLIAALGRGPHGHAPPPRGRSAAVVDDDDDELDF
jgi:hypothetical protein